jgi:hypothetical protein
MINRVENEGSKQNRSGFKPAADQQGCEDLKEHDENSSFKQFKDALKNLNTNGENTIDVVSDKLQEAAKAVGTDLEPIYKYISQNQTIDGRKLLENSTLFQNSIIGRHPKIMKLWNEAAQWERDNGDISDEGIPAVEGAGEVSNHLLDDSIPADNKVDKTSSVDKSLEFDLQLNETDSEDSASLIERTLGNSAS